MDSRKIKSVTISWSGGKDSAFALYKVLSDPSVKVIGLHTVFNSENRRVGLHGIHESLIEKQAEALGIPLEKLYLNSSDDHEEYKKLMTGYYADCVKRNIDGVVFGDIFLEDLRRFRDELLFDSGLTGIYPLWKCDSRALLDGFLSSNFKTTICACNRALFSDRVVGKTLSEELIATFPPQVDVCGENGEFHTFVFDGPIFRKSVSFELGEVVTKEYRYKVRLESGAEQLLRSEFVFQELL